ncbi:PDZ domain-containing protein [Candidatus Uhrbacteria bacterium]|nr:PDZ domain-containing protein [Candidatus Uhrbacteria bacterium]
MTNHSWPQTIRIIVFSCLIGGAAGVLGTALTTSYLSDYAAQLGEVRQTLGLTQTRPRTLPQSYVDALERLEERSLPAVGSLFAASSVGEAGVSIFDSSVPVITLTSDGWMLAESGRLGDIVRFGAQECEVDDVVVEPLLGYVFLHCATSNMSVVDIVGGYGLAAGDQVFVAAQGHEVVFTQAREVVWGDGVRSSDIPSRRIRLTDVAQDGAVVFNVFGEFIGVTQSGEEGMEVVPFEQLAGAFRQVLESVDSITYPSLGVRGIDLAHSAGVDEELSGGHQVGFLLYSPRAVAYGSAGYKAGLLVGDVLLSIDGVTINGTNALDDLLTSYSASDEIQIEIERNGDRQTVTVTLGELEI